MKRYLVILAMAALSGCAMRNYQTCVLSSADGSLTCSRPQDRNGAELKALAVNSMSGGNAVAWSQRVQSKPKAISVDPSPATTRRDD